MKKIILDLINENYDLILDLWKEKLKSTFGDKLSDELIEKFVINSVKIFVNVIKTGDYKLADQYLVDTYGYFSEAKLSLLEVSHIFGLGRSSFLHVLERNLNDEFDPLLVVGFVGEIIEQTFALYGMLYQGAQMKELTKDRDRLAAKLESNQQYLENILHSSDQAIMMIDADEKFIAWNKGAEKIFGYTEQEILNQDSKFLLPDIEDYENEFDNIINQVKETGYYKISDTERKTKDGRVISVQLYLSRLSGPKGNYAGRSVIIKDITREKILQKQVDQSEKLAVIGQLAAGIAHEIGNPLASISAIVQILQRKIEDEWSKEQLSDIKGNIDRITRIVRELVDFSRPPGHEERLTSLSEIIRTALGIVRYDKRVKKVDFITDLDPNIPKIVVVPDQLLQVYVNILLNGIDAINGEGTVEVKTFQDDEFIYSDISDNGCGMDELTIEKIFDPFFTTKEVGKGTGLGLSVSYGIVKKFKGDILVKSNINKGSRFRILLPKNLD